MPTLPSPTRATRRHLPPTGKRLTSSPAGATEARMPPRKGIAALDPALVRDLLRSLLRQRRFAEHPAWREALPPTAGTEAIFTAAASLLESGDWLLASRDGGVAALAHGLLPEVVRGGTRLEGSQPGGRILYDPASRFLGGFPGAGRILSVTAGIALAFVRAESDAVPVCLFDAAEVNAGAFHEALNLAGIWRLPVLFICTNAFYAGATPLRKLTASGEVFRRAEGYGLRAEQADGMDVITLRERIANALMSVRRGDGPYFLEALAYRFDEAEGRSRHEVAHWRARDPLALFPEQALAAGKVDAAEIAMLEA